MSEIAEAESFEIVPEEVTLVTVDTSVSKPEMMMIRRRRRRRGRRNKVRIDPLYRRIHATLIVLVVFLLVVSMTGNMVRDMVLGIAKRFTGSFHGMHQIRLEVVFLIVALLILVYLTPGVEAYVFKKLGIKRGDD